MKTKLSKAVSTITGLAIASSVLVAAPLAANAAPVHQSPSVSKVSKTDTIHVPIYVKATNPTFNNKTKKIYIPGKVGVRYYINGTYKAPRKSYSYKNKGKVTAKPESSIFRLTGATSWGYDYRTAVKPTAPRVKVSGGYKTITIPGKTGVKYYYEGKLYKKGTSIYSSVKKTATVTAKASSGNYKLTGKTKWVYKLTNV